MDMLLLTTILVVVITLYITRWLSIEVTSLLIPPALVLTGILDVKQALSGFSSSATVTIGALFVVSAALTRTGALDFLAATIKRYARESPLRLLVIMAVTVPLISAFMNNIPVVAMLLPVILVLARDMKIMPSKVMIPLSYFAILGGTCTLIGTGTNIVVHEFYMQTQVDAGLTPTGFSMFEFAPLGLILLVSGALFILLLGPRLLPERTSLTSMLPRARTAKFVTEIEIDSESLLTGQRVSDVFPPDSPVRLLEIIRGEEVIVAGAARETQLMDKDALIIEGAGNEIAEFLSQTRASLATVVEDDRRVPMRSIELMLGEAVILPDSPFAGRTVDSLALNKQYGVKVMAVQRGGRHHRKNVRKIVLRAGDVLLVQASERGFQSLRDSESVLIVEGLEGAIKHKKRVFVAVAVLLAVVGLASLTTLPIVVLAVTGAALMIATRCLRIDEAVRSLDFPVLLLLIGTIPLGVAMCETGLAHALVHQVTGFLGASHPIVFLSAFYLVTSLTTNVLSNKATAVLLAPIAFQLAAQLNVDPKPFLIAICYAASASFATPIGYPTNLIVMGPGGYHFGDYLKIGVPMNLLMWALATLLIPVFWPFLP